MNSGGIFYSKEKDSFIRPFFTALNENGSWDREEGEELATTTSGLYQRRVHSDPTVLYPNEYVELGTLTEDIKIISLAPGKYSNMVYVYAGEFTISAENPKKIAFPNSIKWSQDSVKVEKAGTYQFNIINGLGQLKYFK